MEKVLEIEEKKIQSHNKRAKKSLEIYFIYRLNYFCVILLLKGRDPMDKLMDKLKQGSNDEIMMMRFC